MRLITINRLTTLFITQIMAVMCLSVFGFLIGN